MNRSLGFQGIALLDVSRATKTNYYTAADNIHKAGKEISELIDEKLSPNEQSAEKQVSYSPLSCEDRKFKMQESGSKSDVYYYPNAHQILVLTGKDRDLKQKVTKEFLQGKDRDVNDIDTQETINDILRELVVSEGFFEIPINAKKPVKEQVIVNDNLDIRETSSKSGKKELFKGQTSDELYTELMKYHRQIDPNKIMDTRAGDKETGIRDKTRELVDQLSNKLTGIATEWNVEEKIAYSRRTGKILFKIAEKCEEDSNKYLTQLLYSKASSHLHNGIDRYYGNPNAEDTKKVEELYKIANRKALNMTFDLYAPRGLERPDFD